MATVVDLDELWKQRHSLQPQEVRAFPVVAEGDFRIRLLLTRSGNWPQHTDSRPETYVVLRGEVNYFTDREFVAKSGSMVTFAAGEAHSARIISGALSLSLDRKVPHPG
jgi:mannose-6-phosphate isomerase-like protein (cupin superfamily)